MKKIKDGMKKLIASTERDRVMLYAAQACYFVLVSVIPFICLLISVISFFIPADVYTILDVYKFPQFIEDFILVAIEQVFATQKVSLLSISAIFALWTASRGVDSLLVGLERVYHEKREKGFIKHQVKSLLSTIIIIVLLIASIGLALIGSAVSSVVDISILIEIIMFCSGALVFIAMCIAFMVIYAFVGRIGKTKWHDRFRQHLPGAIFTSAGWSLFTYLLYLYIRYFPSASVIYGSLTAVCLAMLWLYVVIVIFLLGAEVNKLIMRERGVWVLPPIE